MALNYRDLLNRSWLFIALIIPFSALAQTSSSVSPVDSLSNLIRNDKEDTNKVNHLHALAIFLMYQNPDTSIILSEQALSIAANLASIPSTSSNNSIKNAAQKSIANSYNYIGNSYYLKGEASLSLDNHFKALKLREAQNDKVGLAKSYNNIGLVFKFQGDHANALEYYFKALKLNVELGNKERIAYSLNNIGLVYNDQKDFDKALDYYSKSLQLHQNMGNLSSVASTLNNIGIVYYEKKNYSKALENYLKALQVNGDLGNSSEIVNNLSNIGATYHKDKNYDLAIEYYNKSSVLSKEIGNKYGIALTLTNIGQIYLEQNKYKESEKYLLEALSISKEIGSLVLVKENNQTLSSLYSKTKRFELAFKHYEQFSIAKDSLFNEDKSKDIGRLEMQHEIEKAQRDRTLKEEEEKRIAQQQRDRKYLLQYSGMFIGLLGIALVVIMIGFVKVSPPMARSVTFFAILLLFEFVLVLLDPYMERFSKGEPLYKLLINAVLAICIFPINAIMERGIQQRLMKK